MGPLFSLSIPPDPGCGRNSVGIRKSGFRECLCLIHPRDYLPLLTPGLLGSGGPSVLSAPVLVPIHMFLIFGNMLKVPK